MGPTISFRGIDNAAYYRLVNDGQALLLRITPAPATLWTCSTPGPSAHHGQPSVLD